MTALLKMLVMVSALRLLYPPLYGQPMKTGFVDIEGRKVYYEERGAGKTILLIHGFTLDSRMWDDQFDAFGREFHVVRHDMSGYGRSTVPDSLISVSNEIASLLRSLGIDKATVVGMSLGGWAAVRFAIDYPQMVEAVVTVEATLEGFQFSEPLRSRLGRYPRLAKDSGLAKAKDAWLNDPFMTPVANSDAAKKRLEHIVAEWSGSQFINPGLWGFRRSTPPALARLHELRVPALIIAGEKDGPDLKAIADTLAGSIPGASKIVIPGSGHLVNLEHPAEFNKVVLDFLRANLGHR